MAKPRKAAKPSRSSGSFGRNATINDLPRDDQDEFEAGRDRILLDHQHQQIRNEDDDEDDFGLNHRQVLEVQSEPSDSDQDSDNDDDEEEEEEDEDEEYDQDDDDEIDQDQLNLHSSKKMAAAVSDNDSDDDQDQAMEDPDELLDKGWGTNKRAYYNTNKLDDIESDSEIDEEQARELELKEVKRLQRKSRSVLDDSDFGLGNDDLEGGLGKALKDAGREKRRKELDLDRSTHTASSSTTAATPTVALDSTLPSTTDKVNAQLVLSKIQKQSPETLALAGEYADMLQDLTKVDAALKSTITETPNHPSLELLHLHHQTLTTYLTAITYYFYLRASPEYVANPAKLIQHPVVTRMMKLKQGLSVMEDLGLTYDGQPLAEVSSNGLTDEEIQDMQMLASSSSPQDENDDEDVGSISDDELAQLLAEGKENLHLKAAKQSKGEEKKKKKNTNSESNTNNVLQPRPIRSKKTKRLISATSIVAPLAAGLADLDDEPVPEIKLKKKKNTSTFTSTSNPFEYGVESCSISAFGEPTQLLAFEDIDKKARKRSLQFHASSIETKSAQRAQSARQKMSGDLDIPYRDRERSRTAVEATKAAKSQILNGKDTSLDEQGWGETDEKDWRDVMGIEKEIFTKSSSSSSAAAAASTDQIDDGEGEGEDYYDLITNQKKRIKMEKKKEYETQRNQERWIADEIVEPGQHRGINRNIEKNKGLTPHRSKTVRNPRVKKRIKYEQAKKKLSSRQAVFKGGLANLQGGYSGEKSGISSHLIRSRKLG